MRKERLQREGASDSIASRFSSWSWRLAVVAMVSATFMMAVLMVDIYKYSRVTDNAKADTAIVLGASVWNDKPSPVFEERIKHAINLKRNSRVRYLVFTGGVGDGEKFAESEVAKKYAIANGVPAGTIFMEVTSRTTVENLVETKKIMDANQLDSALVVSDPLHMKRAMAIAEDLGVSAYPSPTPSSRYKSWKTKSELLAREIYYYVGHMFRRLLNRSGFIGELLF